MTDAHNHTDPRLRENVKRTVNEQRDTTDEIAKHYGADDPMHPWGPQLYTDWVDFTDKVATPLVEAMERGHDDPEVQRLMAAFRTQNPYFFCIALTMARRRAFPDDLPPREMS